MVWIFSLAVLVVLQLQVSIGNESTLGGTCETLPSTIHITKEQYGEGGQLERTCEAEIAVSKCEGTCNSQVQPSVVNPSGFLKDCHCCRESSLRERHVSLTNCFDSDGKRLTGELESMTVRLREPSDCRCFRCGDHS